MTTVTRSGEGTDTPYSLSHLDALESEAVHIFREVAGEFERPVILFSGG
ncbi:sulfate adenylyltransferase subunit CysD, partial [Streptomyces sp. NPDC002514]